MESFEGVCDGLEGGKEDESVGDSEESGRKETAVAKDERGSAKGCVGSES